MDRGSAAIYSEGIPIAMSLIQSIDHRFFSLISLTNCGILSNIPTTIGKNTEKTIYGMKLKSSSE